MTGNGWLLFQWSTSLIDSPMWLLAQTATANEWADLIVKIGVPATLLILFVVAWTRGVIPSPDTVASLKVAIAAGEAREHRLEASYDALLAQFNTVALPTLSDALASLRQSADMVVAATEAIRQNEQALNKNAETMARAETILGLVLDRLKDGGR